ncbi:unnamed protein product, partial [Vitis vinifera]
MRYVQAVIRCSLRNTKHTIASCFLTSPTSKRAWNSHLLSVGSIE